VAEASGDALDAGGIAIHIVKPDWARFSFPRDIKAAE
jgi:hypothetical protein